jgi:uncharacterized protein
MSLEYPDLIDPNKAAEGQRVFSGTIPISRMERLMPFLADTQDKDSLGEASFSAQFDKDSLVGVKIQVNVEAALWLVCQRSLEPYQELINRSSLLGVIDDISKEGLLPEGYEGILAENGKVAFLTMVEDELLLALPQVPRNPDFAPIDTGQENELAVQESGKEPRQQPFAGLADQLKEFAKAGKK